MCLQDLKNSPVRADADFDATMFDSIFDKDQYPMPAPIHYINYHAGECKSKYTSNVKLTLMQSFLTRFCYYLLDLLFGISLAEYAQQYQRSPPLIVTRCIECIESQGGLEREGIYRISGKQSNIDRLKQYFERDEASAVPGQGGVPNDVFSVASVLKIFLRDLASPLFPFKLSDRATYSSKVAIAAIIEKFALIFLFSSTRNTRQGATAAQLTDTLAQTPRS